MPRSSRKSLAVYFIWSNQQSWFTPYSTHPRWLLIRERISSQLPMWKSAMVVVSTRKNHLVDGKMRSSGRPPKSTNGKCDNDLWRKPTEIIMKNSNIKLNTTK